MNLNQFNHIVNSYLSFRKVFREYPQLFNRAIAYYKISSLREEYLHKYYVLDSDDAGTWVNDKQLAELARKNSSYWDTSIRKKLTDRIITYMNFYLSEIPLKDRPIETSYLSKRVTVPLKAAGIVTIGHILKLPNIDALEDIPKIGRKAMRELGAFVEDVKTIESNVRNQNEKPNARMV